MLLGLEFVSTIPKTGIPKRLASFTAICSFITSTTNRAAGKRVKSAIQEGLQERKNDKLELEASEAPVDKMKKSKAPSKVRTKRGIDESALNANVADKFLKGEKE